MYVPKRKAYGSGALVPIYLNIHHLNSMGLWMLQSFSDFNSSLPGCPLPLFSGAYSLVFDALQ